MAEIATAYVQLIPSFKGMSASFDEWSRETSRKSKETQEKQQQQYAKGFGETFRNIAKLGGQTFKTVGKIGLGAISAVTTAVGVMAVKGGFSRALAIDTARAKMKGLGWDTQKISKVMENATSAVKGTAFGLDEASTVASMFGASGIKAGSEMEKSLKAVANVAAASGRSMTDIGTIFSSIQARGKLMGDDMLQLTSSGVPVLQLLADKLGTTKEAVSEMVSKGQIDFATFSDAMREGLGESATAMGNTVGGAFRNVKAALSRVGQQFASPITDNLTPLLLALQPLIDVVGERLSGFATNLGNKIGDGLSSAAERVGSFTAFLSNLKLPKIEFGKIFAGLGPAIGAAVGHLGGFLQTLPRLGRLFGGLTGPVGAVIGGFVSMYTQSEPFRQGISALIGLITQIAQDALPVFGVAAEVSGQAFKFLGDVLGPVLSFVSQFSGLIEVAAAAFLVYAGAVKAISLATEIWGVITKIQTGLQIALNLAMSLNPIGLVIAAIVAVIAAIYLLWNHCKPFRDFVLRMWEAIKEKVQAVADWFTGTLVPWFGSVWEGIKSAFNSFIQWFSDAWAGIKNFVSSVWKGIKSVVLAVWGGIVNGVKAYINGVKQSIQTALGFIKSVWSNVWNWVKNLVTRVWGGIKTAVSIGINGVVGFVKGLPDKIKNVFSSAGKWLWDAGKKIIQGLIDGIKNMFSNVKDTLSNLTSKLTSWKGPPRKDSKLLFGAGELVIAGFKDGLESQYGAVEKSLSGFTNRLSAPTIGYDYAPAGTPGYGMGRNGARGDRQDWVGAEVKQYFPNVNDPQAAALAAAQGILGVPFTTRRQAMA